MKLRHSALYWAYTEDLIQSPVVRQMDQYVQHAAISTLEHCLLVSYLSLVVCRALRMQPREAVRGALLHDLFLYDWHDPRGTRPNWHGFRHPGIALKNAKGHFALTAREENAIARHMWPLTPTPPGCAAGYVVSLSDKLATLWEVSRLFNQKRARIRGLLMGEEVRKGEDLP